jgi:S-formylglutathione hydrolase FrmB
MFMKSLSLRSAIVAAAISCCGAGRAGVTTQTVTFHSKALDAQTTYIAALPSPLEPGRKYPVLYLLHGATGGYRDWTERTTLTEELDGRGMIVITPDGSKYGWYLDSEIDPASQYDTLISRDLVADVEKRFPARHDRGGRGIAGLSMGGHGALSLAAKHPDLYGSASSLSGILDIAAHPKNWSLDKILGKQPENLDRWKASSVYYLADRFTTAGVALLFDTGVKDETGAVDDARRLHTKLEELGVEHIYHEFPGKHDWKYWGEHIPEHLDFHEKVFKAGEDRGE